MMSATREEILDAALRLPESDRLDIAHRLMETLPDELPGLSEDEPHLVEELDRRWANREDCTSWTQLRDEPLKQ
jgi:hypothetical protein